MHKRQAQIQIGEMVMVLIVVFILIFSTLVWYVNSSGKKTTRIIEDDARVALAQTAHAIADLPEIRYSLAGKEDSMVIDWKRAQAFKENIDDTGRDVYRDRFNGYKVELRCITPCENRPFGSLTLFSYINSEAARKNSVQFLIPVLLYEPITKQSSFGSLTVTQVRE